MRKRLLIGAGIVVLALAAAGGAYVLVKERQSADVRGSSTVEFVPTTPAVEQPKEPGVVWETYGYDPERLRFAPFDLRNALASPRAPAAKAIGRLIAIWQRLLDDPG